MQPHAAARALLRRRRARGRDVDDAEHVDRAVLDGRRPTQAACFSDLMTPVIKAFFTDMGFEAANIAMQCYGGHGYIRDNGVEQFVRDGRINQIYEGANGVQAMDLVGRKLGRKGGAAPMALFAPDQWLARRERGRRQAWRPMSRPREARARERCSRRRCGWRQNGIAESQQCRRRRESTICA